MLATPAFAVELFRYRGAAKDGGTLEYWLVAFSNTIRGPIKEMFFVVVLPDGTVVEPGVVKRL
jgi:hypothetical protein